MSHLNEANSVLLGESRAVEMLRSQIVEAAALSTPVLIYGPSGAGKGVTARAIHAASRRRGPFMSIDMSQASELMSHNADMGDAGVLDSTFSSYPVIPGDCHDVGGGTVFLKEICQLHPSSQIVLLHALKGELFQSTGDSTSRNSFRLISATSIAPKHLLKEGRFREKLLRRLGSMTITVPSLVQRHKDIPMLALHFLSVLPESERPLGCTAAAMRRLQDYHWPGNVRELQRVVTAAATLAPGIMLDEMAIAFALDTVDREHPVREVPADSPLRDEESGRVASQDSHLHEMAGNNYVARSVISYGHRPSELLTQWRRAAEDQSRTRH